MSDSLGRLLTQSVVRKFRQDIGQIVRCGRLLSTDEFWSRPNQRCNSVANLVLHLTGNLSQWVLAGIDGRPMHRDRPAEFAAREKRPAAVIVPPLEVTVAATIRIIESLNDEQLLRHYSIQEYDVSGVEAVYHVGEHFAFHTGQIVHMTKAIKDVDLSLYDAQGHLAGRQGGQPYA